MKTERLRPPLSRHRRSNRSASLAGRPVDNTAAADLLRRGTADPMAAAAGPPCARRGESGVLPRLAVGEDTGEQPGETVTGPVGYARRPRPPMPALGTHLACAALHRCIPGSHDSAAAKASSSTTTFASRASSRLKGSMLEEPTVAHLRSITATLACRKLL